MRNYKKYRKTDMYPLYRTPGKEGIFVRYDNEYKRKAVEMYRKVECPKLPDRVKWENFQRMIRK